MRGRAKLFGVSDLFSKLLDERVRVSAFSGDESSTAAGLSRLDPLPADERRRNRTTVCKTAELRHVD